MPTPHPRIKPLGTLPTARLEAGWREGADSSFSEAGCRTSALLPVNVARGQSAPRAKGSCSLWDASQPTSFAAREETHHQVRVGVCMVGAGQGGLLAVSCPKPENEICLRTRERWKTSEFNSKHLEKEGRKKCFCLHQGQTSGSRLPCSLQLWVSCIKPRQPLRGSTRDGGMRFKSP